MRYIFRINLAAWLLVVTVIASSGVGTMPTCEPLAWTLPWRVLLLLSSAAWLGWFACWERMKNKEQ